MKIEIGEKRPENFVEYWPGQFEVFSHFEFASGIPSVLFAITTIKENGKPNVSFNAWSSFSGCGGTGFFAILPDMAHNSHTYQNIQRTGEFVINFLSKAHYDACIQTIRDNGEDADELAVGGFAAEKASALACPRLKEAFLCLECKLEKEVTLAEGAPTSLMIGKVLRVAAEETYANGIDGKYGDDGFMLNIHEPRILATGTGSPSAVAVCKVARVLEEG